MTSSESEILSALFGVSAPTAQPSEANEAKAERLDLIKEQRDEFLMWNILESKEPLSEPMDIGIDQGGNTACWRKDKEKHLIFVGSDCNVTLKTPSSKTDLAKHVLNLLRHERAHAKYTHPDLEALQDVLKTHNYRKTPFRAFNLAEDARIEYKDREVEGPFGWAKYEKTRPADSVWTYLFNIIQYDGEFEVPMTSNFRYSANKIKDTQQFYKALCLAKDSFSAARLTCDFFAKYPEAEQDIPQFHVVKGSGSGKGLSDLEGSLDLQQNDSKLAALLAGMAAAQAGNGGAAPVKTQVSSVKVPELSYGDALRGSYYPGEIKMPDQQQVSDLADVMAMALNPRQRWKSSNRVSKQLDVVGMILRDKPYRHLGKSHGTELTKIYVVVDLSGSMAREPSRNARILLAVLGELVKRNLVEGRVCFSVENRREVYELPLADEDLKKVEGYGGYEGLESNMRAIAADLRKHDYVIAYTDANINDDPVDKAWFNGQGITTIGAYVGDEDDMADETLQYFDKALSHTEISGLIDLLVGHITQNR